MALIERLSLDAVELRRLARRGLATALRTVADALREETELHVGAASVAATPPKPPEPVKAEPESAGEPAPRFGAAAWVDAAQEARLVDAAVAEADEPETPAAPTAPAAAVLHDKVIDVLHTIFDPEIPVDIFELGLIYDVDVREDFSVHVRMTLTSPNCPAAQSLPGEVETKVRDLEGVTGASVEVVFEPPWTPDLMSDEAKLELNIL